MRYQFDEGSGECNPWFWGFPDGSAVKKLPANAGGVSSILGLGRSPGEGNDNPLQNTCLGNPMDRGAWQATVQGVKKRVGHDLEIKQQQQFLVLV